MLQPIEQIETDQIKLMSIYLRLPNWVAVDPDTGAFMAASNGRTRSGITRYWLIKPNEPLAERGMFGNYTWSDGGRKSLRAWSLAEAIEIGNKKLAAMTK